MQSSKEQVVFFDEDSEEEYCDQEEAETHAEQEAESFLRKVRAALEIKDPEEAKGCLSEVMRRAVAVGDKAETIVEVRRVLQRYRLFQTGKITFQSFKAPYVDLLHEKQETITISEQAQPRHQKLDRLRDTTLQTQLAGLQQEARGLKLTVIQLQQQNSELTQQLLTEKQINQSLKRQLHKQIRLNGAKAEGLQVLQQSAGQLRLRNAELQTQLSEAHLKHSQFVSQASAAISKLQSQLSDQQLLRKKVQFLEAENRRLAFQGQSRTALARTQPRQFQRLGNLFTSPYYCGLTKGISLRLRRACIRRKQLLYKDNSIEAGVIACRRSEDVLIAKVFVRNVSRHQLVNLSFTVAAQRLNWSHDQLTASSLPADSQICIQLQVQRVGEEFGALMLQVGYGQETRGGEVRLASFLLPTTSLKLMQLGEAGAQGGELQFFEVSYQLEEGVAKDHRAVMRELTGAEKCAISFQDHRLGSGTIELTAKKVRVGAGELRVAELLARQLATIIGK